MRYPKPIRFSDPHCDWADQAEELAAIIRKEDHSLTTEDYRIIYSKALPAADYEEGAYYIEKCAEHIAMGKEVHCSRFPEGYLWWLAHYWDRIVQDGLDAEVKHLIVSSFWTLLGKFELFDLTEEECTKVGRDFRYSVGPYNQHTVQDFIDEITIYDPFEPELDRMIQRLIESDDLAHVRWYIEIACHVRIWALLYDEAFAELDNFKRKESVFHRIHTFPVLKKKHEATLEVMKTEAKPKYYQTLNLFL